MLFIPLKCPKLESHQKICSGEGGGGGGGGGGHSHGACGCEGEHEPAERGLEYGLYRRIDVEKLQCLNESREGDGKLVFKPWDQRKDREKVLQSVIYNNII